MTSWQLVVLGSGSAKPTANRAPSAQALCVGRTVYLIDCGEGTQMQLCKAGIPLERILAIFITHLHADHTLGLFGLLASLSMSGRTAPLQIFAHQKLKTLLDDIIALFIVHLNFEIVFHPLPNSSSEIIYTDKQLSVSTIPLHHRIPTSGFKFVEHTPQPNIRTEIVKQYNLNKEQIATLKRNENITLADNTTLLATKVIYQRHTARSFAYMSDTLYTASAAQYVGSVDLLYHEATYMQELLPLAKQTGHSTAQQAATFAKLTDAKKLLIGHYSARYPSPSPLLDEAKAIFANSYLAFELDKHLI